jgi:hypothetical protein
MVEKNNMVTIELDKSTVEIPIEDNPDEDNTPIFNADIASTEGETIDDKTIFNDLKECTNFSSEYSMLKRDLEEMYDTSIKNIQNRFNNYGLNNISMITEAINNIKDVLNTEELFDWCISNDGDDTLDNKKLGMYFHNRYSSRTQNVGKYMIELLIFLRLKDIKFKHDIITENSERAYINYTKPVIPKVHDELNRDYNKGLKNVILIDIIKIYGKPVNGYDFGEL